MFWGSKLLALAVAGLSVFSTATAASSSSSSSSIVIKGNKFFYAGNGSQFYIKGVAYQQDVTSADSSFTDPLADYDGCKRDLPYLLKLGTNALRVYAVNTTEDHSDCINLFADNGIYIIADLSEPTISINRDDPSWTVTLYDRYAAVIDDLQQYDNVLGFFAGNEVTNNDTNTEASAYVKAAVRDMKAYISDKGYRAIPVGYSTNDDSDTRVNLLEYFNCGDDDEAVDFYGINMYEWCGTSTFAKSGYEDRTKEFANYSVPVFFSEYGCNEVTPRKFQETGTLYSSDMTDVWSGGIVYMYFEEANNYGLVTLSGSSIKTESDFNYLSSAIADISPSSVNSASYTPTNTNRASCPTATNWSASSNLPPTPDKDACDCLSNLACTVSSSVDTDDYSTLFAYVCSEVSCDELNGNATSGEYGTFSYCGAEAKLNWALNHYYSENGASSSACDFSGSASYNSKATSNASCSKALASASSAADESSSGGSNSKSSGSKSGSSSKSSSSSSWANPVSVPTIGAGELSMLVILGTFFFGGIGFVLF